jgi:hypothetical protein
LLLRLLLYDFSMHHRLSHISWRLIFEWNSNRDLLHLRIPPDWDLDLHL